MCYHLPLHTLQFELPLITMVEERFYILVVCAALRAACSTVKAGHCAIAATGTSAD